MATVTPRIYVACLAAYNNGKLHGKWVDASLGEDHIHEEIKDVLATSPEPGAEEWAVHDYEGFDGFELGENPDIALVAKLAEVLEDGDNGEVIVKLMSHMGYSKNLEGLEEAQSYFEENYAGAHKSLEDWAYEFVRDTQGDPEKTMGNLANYIDWEKYGRDAELGGDIFTIDTEDGMVHVFWNR